MENRIGFEKYQLEDFADYFELVKDDKVMKYITGRGMSKAEARNTFDRFLEINRSTDSLGYFKVFDRETQTRIGECKLVDYDKDPSVFEIGYLVREPFWKQGYGTMICERMLALAASINPRKNIIGVIDPKNQASRKLLEKFGFVSFFTGIEDELATEKLVLRTNESRPVVASS